MKKEQKLNKMKKSITIQIKYIKSENAFRIWGNLEDTDKGFWLPGLSSDVSEIPEGVRKVAEGLLNL